jgi:hypothetical protein
VTVTTTLADPADDEEPEKPKSRRGRSKSLTPGIHPNSVTSPESIAARQREAQALELRQAGVSLERIAQIIGVHDASGAFKIIMRGLNRLTQEPAENLRKLEGERLDRLQRAMWSKALAGNHLAVDRCLAIMERRARLLGLDAPIRIKQETISEEDLDRAIQNMIREAEHLEAARQALEVEDDDVVDAVLVDPLDKPESD